MDELRKNIEQIRSDIRDLNDRLDDDYESILRALTAQRDHTKQGLQRVSDGLQSLTVQMIELDLRVRRLENPPAA